MEELYELYRDTDGWWNDYGESTYTPIDFLAQMTYYELQGLTSDEVAADYAWQIMAKKMQWMCQQVGSSCNGVILANAIFNYVATRESAGDRYDAYFGPDATKLHTWNEYTYSFDTAKSIAIKAVFQANTADPKLGPLPDWGNASMFSGTAQTELSNAQIGWCTTCVLYSSGGGSNPAYFLTDAQVNYFYGK